MKYPDHRPRKKKTNDKGEKVQAFPVSRREWNSHPQDYKSTIKGIKYMMFNRNGAANLSPVYISEVDEQSDKIGDITSSLGGINKNECIH